jgi:fructose-1,6-bisphosphatase/inositol monophosphatase family enzyme
MHPINTFLHHFRSDLTNSLSEILKLRATRTEKADQSYVTEGDLLVQRLVLEAAAKHLPQAKVISEEQKDGAHDGSSGITVVVDPIDGTENFTSGLMEWGVSIACYEDGQHVASLIGCPELGQWLQTGDSLVRHQSRIRGLSSSLTKEDIQKATSGFEYRVMGCCVYNMMNVIRGAFCSFENPKGAWSWDILAGFNLALEHGLEVTVEGKPYCGEYLGHTKKFRFRVGL